MGIRVFILALIIGVSVQATEKPFAWRECEREISERRQEYTVAYEEEAISETLYGAVMGFLETTQEKLNSENCIEVYSNFVEDYQELLRVYPKVARQTLGKKTQEKEVLGIVEQTRAEYNSDMRYIQGELQIYGEYVDFELSEEEFEELLTVYAKEEANKEEGLNETGN